MKDKLKYALQKLYFEVSEEQAEQFLRYYEMLIEKNKVMNLTAITDYDEVVQKHFVDSLTLSKAVDLRKVDTLIDMGTGAGFPGIPLKIMYPHMRVVLMDALNKRINFLNEVIDELKLEKIEAVHARAEDLARLPDFREHFDLCVSRAVANLATLSEYCMPFVRIGGSFVSYKSGNITEELQSSMTAVNILGGTIGHIESFELPDSDMMRSLVVINKTKPTGKKYPRKSGKPAKEPLS